MMRTATRRLRVLRNHTVTGNLARGLLNQKADVTSPEIVVTPRTSLISDKVRIQLHGLEPNQMVRLVANVEENNVKFESSAVFRASPSGDIDLDRDASLDGTYTGVDSMGLFWSLHPCPGQGEGIRFVKKYVTIPKCVKIKAVRETKHDSTTVSRDIITETSLERLYLKKGVRRVPVNEGRLRGTIFIPEGPGPFPALIDMSGGIVSLIELRAALLASHGYATFALAYMYLGDLPHAHTDVTLDYFQDAAEWFSEQPYVDATRLGSVGLCFGGQLSLLMAATMPLIKAVVNINGISIMPGKEIKLYTKCPKGHKWPDADKIYGTNEGFVINRVFDCDDPHPTPAWQHGANILFIVGEDDKQVHPDWHRFCQEHWPAEFKNNFEMHTYPGAGHLIESPYTPYCRAANYKPKTERKKKSFVPERFSELLMMTGGYLKQHSLAQIDAWERIITFLDRTLKYSNLSKTATQI